MLNSQINLNQLKIFISVFETKSMTLAARELGLTQSGVSQHIKALEETLDLKLFDRVTHKLVPTAQAHVLYKSCSGYLSSLEEVLARLQAGQDKVVGTVSLGMPIEFGNNLIMPLLAEFCRENPLTNLQLRMGFADEMNEGLLSGDLDFAFVDSYHLDRRVEAFRVYDEVLHLVASKSYCLENAKAVERNHYEELDYISYHPGAPVIRMWFKQKLARTHIDLKIRTHVRDVQAVARLVCNHLGCGVLPAYLVTKLKHEGHDLIIFGDPQKEVHNAISVAYLKDKTHTTAAQTLKQYLLDGLHHSPTNV